MQDMWRKLNYFLSQYLPPAVRWIFVINIVVFLLMAILSIFKPIGIFFLYLMETPEAIKHGYVWQFVTYMFLHANIWHLAGNMLVLWFFAPRLEYRWGTAKFLRFYFIVGIGAGIFHALLGYMSGHYTAPLLGASGAIYGVMLAYALYYPDDTVLLYFVFPIKIKYLMIVFGVLTFLFSMQGDQPGGISHVTHLGGLLVAFLYLKGSDLFGGWRGRHQKSGPRVFPGPGRGQWR